MGIWRREKFLEPTRNRTVIFLSCGLWSNHYTGWRFLPSSKYDCYLTISVCNNELYICAVPHTTQTNARIVSVCTSRFLPSYFQHIFLAIISVDSLWSHYRTDTLNISITNKYLSLLITGELIRPLEPHIYGKLDGAGGGGGESRKGLGPDNMWAAFCGMKSRRTVVELYIFRQNVCNF